MTVDTSATEADETDDTQQPVPQQPAKAGARPKAVTEKKGRPTPKRSDAQRRRPAEPPPANRREAVKRMRARQKVERAEQRQAMLRGDESALLPRDRGPERAVTRDIIDSRRNVGTWFFLGALVVLIGTSRAMPPVVRTWAEWTWIALALSFALDSVLICRRVKRLVLQRVPDTTIRPWKLYFYAVMRSITFRRLRVPKPRVKIGDPI